jgi:hypothetical protein
MATYDVYLIRTMSQVVTVDAESEEDAIGKACDEHDLDPNISNSFEADGDVEVHSVTKTGD